MERGNVGEQAAQHTNKQGKEKENREQKEGSLGRYRGLTAMEGLLSSSSLAD
jgi:hypothetical protein